MKTALEASKLALPENNPVKISTSCDAALDTAVLEAIQKWKHKIDIALWFKQCRDDETITAYLLQQWYKDVEVSHDYPWYCESYAGRTFIKFTF